MSIESVAIYAGYAFCQAVNVQVVLEKDALMVPYAVYWNQLMPSAIPYEAETQSKAVESLTEARLQNEKKYSGWSSGRDGLITLKDGRKHDVLFIEAKVPSMTEPLVIFYLYKNEPFNLVGSFNFQPHTELRNTKEEKQEFMRDFVKGVEMHSSKSICVERVKNALSL